MIKGNVIRTGKGWLKVIGKKTYYSPYLEEGKYYRLKTIVHSFEMVIYLFEEVEIVD